jgi:uncharacterized membrane protein YgcG
VRRFGFLVFALVLVLASPARAQSTGERITSYTFDARIADDGELAVTESITYDFGSTEHHGIYRDIPTRLSYDKTHDRVYPLSDVSVTSPDAPAKVTRTSGDGGTTRLRIGDASASITGVHHYVIRYRMSGALNPFSDHVELYWNAIGAQWQVPIDRATATIVAPVPVDRVTCFAGPQQSSNPCDASSVDGRSARFTQAHLDPYQALTFVVSLPPGSVTATGPILEERWTPQRAFSATPGILAATFALLGLIVAALGTLVWRVGRDRRALGSPVDVAFGEGDGSERVPLWHRGEVPVELEPPDGMRPGQLGTLIDERANPLDVTATIVDLAVRGFLRIEEIEKAHWFSKGDWRLVRLKDGDGLLSYERRLFDALFASGDGVELSDLKNKFAAQLHKVQNDLYDDAVDRGWFAGRPDRVRALWLVAGVAALAGGVGLTIVVAMHTHLGLVPIPIAVGGVLLIAMSPWMPHRTVKGTGVLTRTLGFKRFIDESERDRAQFAEKQHLFTEYLPYAVVFGATEQWAKAFAGLDGTLPDQSSWYVSNHPFTYIAFSHSMDGFATTTAGTIASTPSGSGTSGFGGGGFSGGGGCGGGGGSW